MSNKSKKDWKKVKTEATHAAEMLDDEDLMDFEETSDNTPQTAGLEHPDYHALEEKLTLAEQKAHENWEKAARALAELENVRRRAERDVASAHKYALERFVNQLLPVVDSLEQAIQLVDSVGDQAMHEGLMLTMKLLLDVLQKNNVEQLDPVGERFDPQQHEAMSMQVAPDTAPNTVLVVFQKGYKLNERVIRPARVIVSKDGA